MMGLSWSSSKLQMQLGFKTSLEPGSDWTLPLEVSFVRLSAAFYRIALLCQCYTPKYYCFMILCWKGITLKMISKEKTESSAKSV